MHMECWLSVASYVYTPCVCLCYDQTHSSYVVYLIWNPYYCSLCVVYTQSTYVQ